jgi:hypothetical protein
MRFNEKISGKRLVEIYRGGERERDVYGCSARLYPKTNN